METQLPEGPCLNFVTSDDGTVLAVNGALCRRLGYAATDLVGRRCDHFLPLASRIFQQTHLYPLLKMQGYAEEIFLHLRTQSGEDLPVLLNAERHDGASPVIHYAGIVVRHRKEFEEELIAARKTAEAALRENTMLLEAKQSLQEQSTELDRQIERVKQQNSELRQFSRVVTHDLQEPMRKLLVFADMLLDESADAVRSPILEKVRRVSGQLRDIIHGLQQYVWLSEATLRCQPIEFEPMLRAAAARVESDHEGVSLRVESIPSVRFEADREQASWMLYEILNNAVRFRSQPDSARVEVFAEVLQQNRFRHMEDRYDYIDYLRLRFRDDGRGFDPAYAGQASELFRRLHNDSGRGIGLALCHKIMDHHGGTIRLDSQPGVGTTVTLLFPLSGSAKMDGEQAPMAVHVPLQTGGDS
ncbi:ATP-binding protein [Flaviaesturariibacter terrae]